MKSPLVQLPVRPESKVTLGGREFSDCHACIIAEVAQAHDGSLGTAHAFIDAAAEAGADAIKFQTHIAEAESTIREPWRVKFSRQDATRLDYWRRMMFTPEQWLGLRHHADHRGLLFLSSAFSPEAVDLLERVGMPAWKVASGEVGNVPLLQRMLSSGVPMLISSGMSNFAELDRAVELCRAARSAHAVFQCTTAYPAPPEKVGLNQLQVLGDRYGVPVGLSDHSGTIYAGLAAATCGVAFLEVHVTFHRKLFGPDVPASVTFEELRQLVDGVRFIERMRASPVDKDAFAETLAPMRTIFGKSIVARTDLPAGWVLTEADIALKKPGDGIPASAFSEVLGRTISRPLSADQALQWSDLS